MNVDISELPLDTQKMIVEFVEFLKVRNGQNAPAEAGSTVELADEEFVGMWADRSEFEESSAWVRNLRETGWQ